MSSRLYEKLRGNSRRRSSLFGWWAVVFVILVAPVGFWLGFTYTPPRLQPGSCREIREAGETHVEAVRSLKAMKAASRAQQTLEGDELYDELIRIMEEYDE